MTLEFRSFWSRREIKKEKVELYPTNISSNPCNPKFTKKDAFPHLWIVLPYHWDLWHRQSISMVCSEHPELRFSFPLASCKLFGANEVFRSILFTRVGEQQRYVAGNYSTDGLTGGLEWGSAYTLTTQTSTRAPQPSCSFPASMRVWPCK